MWLLLNRINRNTSITLYKIPISTYVADRVNNHCKMVNNLDSYISIDYSFPAILGG